MIDDLLKGAAATVAAGAIILYSDKALAEPNVKALDSMAQRLANAGYVIDNSGSDAWKYLVDTMTVWGIVLRKNDNPSMGRPTVVVEMYKGEADQWENKYWDNIMPDAVRDMYGRVTVKNAPDVLSDGLFNAVQAALSGTEPTTGFDGKYNPPVGTERSSWSSIKSLYGAKQRATWQQLQSKPL
jgi:hypothetical protein